jgi:hypothetical protein
MRIAERQDTRSPTARITAFRGCLPGAHRSSPGLGAAGIVCLVTALLATGCGGGGSNSGGSGGTGTAPPAGPTTADRSAAASTTAQSSTNACAPIRPFYWELGDQTAALASGSITSSTDPTVDVSSTQMSIASASKWLYSSYFVQKQNGVLSTSDIKFMTFTSGYTNFTSCQQTVTVQQCVDTGTNGVYSAATDGMFSYGGGHMEKHASLVGLGPLANGPLATEIKTQLGSDVAIAYTEPQLAGGVVTSADNYARFLRKILAGSLKMHDALGTHAVCTNPLTCPTAANTPVPATESWHYSIGHWVEDDPVVGDGAFSSAGAFGFYPWIDAGKTTYGIVARSSGTGSGFDSASCGRLIRKAWATAVAQ